MSMIDKFLHSSLFLLMFDLDFAKIQAGERVRIFFKIGSDFIQDSELFKSYPPYWVVRYKNFIVAQEPK